jgi:hypothetical protein
MQNVYESFNKINDGICFSMVTQLTHILSVLIIMEFSSLATRNHCKKMCCLKNCKWLMHHYWVHLKNSYSSKHVLLWGRKSLKNRRHLLKLEHAESYVLQEFEQFKQISIAVRHLSYICEIPGLSLSQATSCPD